MLFLYISVFALVCCIVCVCVVDGDFKCYWADILEVLTQFSTFISWQKPLLKFSKKEMRRIVKENQQKKWKWRFLTSLVGMVTCVTMFGFLAVAQVLCDLEFSMAIPWKSLRRALTFWYTLNYRGKGEEIMNTSGIFSVLLRLFQIPLHFSNYETFLCEILGWLI